MTNPVAYITSQELMRHTLTGARAGDAVLPERPRRLRRRPRARTARTPGL